MSQEEEAIIVAAAQQSLLVIRQQRCMRSREKGISAAEGETASGLTEANAQSHHFAIQQITIPNSANNIQGQRPCEQR